MLPAEQILTDALKLNADERAKLLDALSASLDGEELSPKWEDTIARRVAELDSGSVETVAADVVFQKLEQRFGVK
jgi:putative addiction module component (TIGR02574 family)